MRCGDQSTGAQFRFRNTILWWDLQYVSTFTTHGGMHYPTQPFRKSGSNIEVDTCGHEVLVIASVNLNDDGSEIGFLSNAKVHNIP